MVRRTLAGLVVAMLAVLAVDYPQLLRSPPPLVDPVARADRLVVRKAERELVLMRGQNALRRYRVALGSSPVGDKQREGDGRTPQGRYVIDHKNPRSAFHLALHISYPDPTHRDAARSRGADPGGDIMIHGLPNGLSLVGPLHRLMDWTDGCVAVTNAEIEEIWAMTGAGTPVEIEE